MGHEASAAAALGVYKPRRPQSRATYFRGSDWNSYPVSSIL